MSLILNIDTSTTVCSVSLSDKTDILGVKEDFEGMNHSKLLTPFIESLLEEKKLSPKDLSAIAVSKGPGSYTGLRIGVSVAKGIAYALSIPLISVQTLKIMASGFLQENPEYNSRENTLLCPMLDARRMEVYSALFDTRMNEIRGVEAEILGESSFKNELAENEMLIFGDGAFKCKEIIKSDNLIYKKDFIISSRYMAPLAYEKFNNQIFEDVAYFEPFYLKDFIATTPKNNILK